MVSRPDIGPGWADGITLAGIAAPEYRWAEGLTLRDAAERQGLDAADFGLVVISASRLAVTAVLRVPGERSVDELARVISHPAHVGSSDGIYLGGHPHPRGWGSFARFLGRHTRERGDYSWAQAAVHLAGRTAARHGLRDRGRVAVGFAADLAVVDPTQVADTADYAQPRAAAIGVDDVIVNGVPVLAGGRLTGARSGKGLRRNGPVRHRVLSQSAREAGRKHR
jgi:N-acyl-D-amino-acid deacylase